MMCYFVVFSADTDDVGTVVARLIAIILFCVAILLQPTVSISSETVHVFKFLKNDSVE